MTNEMQTWVRHLDDWEVWQHAKRLSPLTITERRRVLRLFCAQAKVQPSAATPLDIVRWIAAHPEWSDSTTATYHAYLVAWFKWLQLQDHRLDNPMMKVGTPHYPDREPSPLSDRDLVRLLTVPMHYRTRVMILLAALAGLRVHEIAKVRGEDIVDGRAIRIVGKGKKLRTVPLHPILIEVVARMPKRGWWFPSNSRCPGEHVLSRSVSDIIGRVMRRGEIVGKPHGLRHWYGTTLLDDGADLRTVQELMRHSSVATTQVYTKVPDDRRRAAIQRLDPFRAAKMATNPTSAAQMPDAS